MTRYKISLNGTYLSRFANYVYLFLILILVACNGQNGTNEAEKTAPETQEEAGHTEEENANAVEFTSRQYEVAGIELGKPQMKNLSQVLKVSGLLDVPPQNLVSISAPLGGFLKSTDLLQGQLVKKGSVIAVIENPEFIQLQQDYLENKSRLDYLNLELTRQKELRAANVNAAKTLQQTEAEYKSVRARVNGLKEKLAMIGISTGRIQSGNIARTAPIISPITGYVTEVNVNIGKYVNPTDELFTIADTDHLHAELTVFEKDAAKISKGQRVRFLLPNENQERTATIYLIGKAVTGDRTIRVHAHLDKEDHTLLPGTFINANIELKGNSVKALPREAVVQADGKNYIFLAKGQRKENNEVMHDFEMLEIMTGVSEDGFVEIFLPENISDSTQIVTKGAYSVLAKIKNTEEEGGGHGH
ncbi:efflux RND transporter periplasmic adaptor subunit [Adhaeribacter sp. BT258]|uniref:Efflux RND transporter periplasmic adaptor subunit n=1 Tax=Adhaeribacter terrigena TaxID=2793070 RepID=A0ABS1BXK7_9BACT|nr:efflux RND transporter periplasmic adaptor subunit [Adhaeribacter terrigena]MBK0401876.1 efflux RND transporter periplasmic adaptor subunit [Adhaeribacter terrigena]